MLSVLSSRNSAATRNQTWTLICFPIVGLLFGLLGFAILQLQQLPIFIAWLIPLLWLLLSGGQHLLSLAKLVNVLLVRGTAEEKLATIELQAVAGMAIACMMHIGKVFALLQSQVLDVQLLALSVLFVPAIARYAALMLALSTDSSHERPLAIEQRGRVVLITTAIILSLGILSPGLLLLLLITSLLLGLSVRILVQRNLKLLPTVALGASVELAEVILLWVPVLAATQGINVLLYSVIL